MADLGWAWKDREAGNQQSKRKPPKPKKIRKKKVRGNNKCREIALKKVKRGSHYTDNVTLCELICNDTGWKRPHNKAERWAIIRKFSQSSAKPKPSPVKSIPGKVFYASKSWKAIRYIVLRNSGGTCQCCGAKASDGVTLHVDHIKPRSKHPELALDLDNLQCICSDCNIGKDAFDDTNWKSHWENI